MAARSIGNATVAFGLVSIPVKLYTTTQSTEGVSFRMLHATCKTPLKQQYVCPTDGEKVERDAVAKGYEFARDQYVVFSPEEIEALEAESTKAIAIEEFISLSLIDPIYYDRAYYLAPDKGGERAYRLLARALEEKQVGGMAKYAARGKEYIVLVRPLEGGLVMQQLRYAEEVRPISEVPIEGNAEVKDAELNLALQLLQQSIADSFHPERYKDESLARFRDILQKKLEGEPAMIVRGEAAPPKVIDLMEALKASLAGGTSQGKGAAAKGAGAKEAGAKETAAKQPATKESGRTARAGTPADAGETKRRPARAAGKAAAAPAGGRSRKSG